jgi:hypothetical protein
MDSGGVTIGTNGSIAMTGNSSIYFGAANAASLLMDSGGVTIGTNGSIQMLGNSSMYFGTTSGNSAVLLDQYGVDIRSNGRFTVDMANFKVTASGQVTITGTINAEAGGNIGGFRVVSATDGRALSAGGNLSASGWKAPIVIVGEDERAVNDPGYIGPRILINHNDTSIGDYAFYAAATGQVRIYRGGIKTLKLYDPNQDAYVDVTSKILAL